MELLEELRVIFEQRSDHTLERLIVLDFGVLPVGVLFRVLVFLVRRNFLGNLIGDALLHPLRIGEHGRLGGIFEHGHQHFFEPLQGDLALPSSCGFADQRAMPPWLYLMIHSRTMRSLRQKVSQTSWRFMPRSRQRMAASRK